MIRCIEDFYCLSGVLRFTKGVDYILKNSFIECGNYHLHNPLNFTGYFNA